MMLPTYRSAAYLLSPRIQRSTRDNDPGPDITRHITSAHVDADIDRAGPKGRIELSASRPDVLPPDAWIAPYLDVIPETGESQSAQMGLYQLGEPRIAWDGIGGGLADNSGEDIIALLDRATLTEAQTTERAVMVMPDIRAAIEYATLASAGRNLITNGTFDAGYTGWPTRSSDASGWVGSDVIRGPGLVRPRGTSSYQVTFSNGNPSGGYRYIMSQYYPVPQGETHLWLSAYSYSETWALTGRMEVRFYDEANTEIAPRIGGAYIPTMPVGTWQERHAMGAIPDGAVQFRVLLLARSETDFYTDYRWHWNGLEVRAVRGTPLTRHTLPDDTRVASTAISHKAGTRWLERINDLLTAIGYHALTATPDGRPTSRPQRDTRTDTPSRIYTLGTDSRITGEIVTDQSRTNLYNRVVAVKEDFQTGSALVAVASNDDPDHPWSTVNKGPISPTEPLTVSEAVDQDALQALADAKLARASMQENIHLSLLPDPTLGVHDIIQLDGTGGPAAGKWAVESIRWGLTADDPLVEVGARRTVTAREVGNDD